MTDQSSTPLVWRSMLFVPSNMPRFVEKAAERGADAIILDLEDSVPASERVGARAGLAAAAKTVGKGGADVLVRINRPLTDAILDLEAAVMPDVQALMLPKIESAEHLKLLEEVIDECEMKAGMEIGATKLLPMIETAGAYFRMDEIAAASRRNVGMTLGGEDFALETGMVPDGETLFMASQKMVYAARAAGIVPLGTIGTVADYQDLDAYRESMIKSRKFGFEGASCIHPSVVPVLNEEFAPKPDEVASAERIISVYKDAQAAGKGAIQLDGKMVDVPVAIRAEKLLLRHRAIEAKIS